MNDTRVFKKFCKTIFVFLIIFSLIGCSSHKKQEGTIIDITYNDMISKINNKETFILQFAKQTCPYCIELEKTERNYLKENNKIIYRFYIDVHSESYKKNIEFLSTFFSDLNSVPTVYWIEKGKPMNQLPILDSKYQYKVLKEWIQDNENYY
ncbi:MAG: hypothetical protein Q4B33_06870 [Fusobacterium sp.]|nr:hypothetical protein [Fusobacterium sp.]